MEHTDRFSRRRVLQVTGAAAATTLVAGCADEGNGEEEDDPEAEDEEENGEPIEGGEEIELGGETQAWIGRSPDGIEEEENPTLTLIEGESYDITWENVDGAQHNIEIWDEDEEVVDDYETELMSEEGETQTLEVDEVTDEMAHYVCEPHEGTMFGDIEVVDEENGDEDENGEDEENGDEDENGDE